MKKSIVGILLAAGKSQRFGSSKLHHILPNGVPVVLQSATNLMQALPSSIAVIRQDDQQIQKILEPSGIKCVINQDADEGMGTSIACGVANSYRADGWIITLGDMPYIPVNLIAKIASLTGTNAKIIAPEFKGRRGHPVGFSSYFRRALLSMRGDSGARKIIEKYQSHMYTIAVQHCGIVKDIDVPEDILA